MACISGDISWHLDSSAQELYGNALPGAFRALKGALLGLKMDFKGTFKVGHGCEAALPEIYLCGGQTSRETTAQVERYNHVRREWEILPPMPTCRSFCCAAGARRASREPFMTKIWLILAYSGQDLGAHRLSRAKSLAGSRTSI